MSVSSLTNLDLTIHRVRLKYFLLLESMYGAIEMSPSRRGGGASTTMTSTPSTTSGGAVSPMHMHKRTFFEPLDVTKTFSLSHVNGSGTTGNTVSGGGEGVSTTVVESVLDDDDSEESPPEDKRNKVRDALRSPKSPARRGVDAIGTADDISAVVTPKS